MSDKGSELKARIRTQFNAVSEDYDYGAGCFAHFGQRLVDLARIRPGEQVLDVACGRGAALFPAVEAAGPGGRVVGVDLAEAMVEATRKDAELRQAKVTLGVMDAENLDFPDGTFDHVLCGFGVMFFPDQLAGLGEFRRVLNPGGRLALSTWQIDQAWEMRPVLMEMGLGPPPSPPGWITEPERLESLLRAADFSDIEVVADTHSFRHADLDEYWEQSRGTGFREVLDGLTDDQRQKMRALLAKRLEPHMRPDGLYLDMTALIATAAK